MKKPYLLLLIFGIILSAASCKKDNSGSTTTAITLSSDNRIVDFKATTQLSSTVDLTTHSVSLLLPFTSNRAAVVSNITLADKASAVVNGSKFQGGQLVLDFTHPLTMAITAENGQTTTWTITVTTDMEKYGLGTTVSNFYSLNKTYSWYIDQYNSGALWSINCGPASVTMAIKWADSTFTHTAEDARNTYRSTGGWWYTTDVVNYLDKYGIKWSYTSLPDDYQTMKKYLDAGDILILCLDNYYLTYNAVGTEHVGKFYKINAAGSGHFIVVKGYRIVDGKFYFEAYDPWSITATYTDNAQLKGLDRYYISTDLATATGVWWDYAIVVAPKGKVVTASTGLKTLALPEQVPAQKGD